jgi:hypothetical protein
MLARGPTRVGIPAVSWVGGPTRVGSDPLVTTLGVLDHLRVRAEATGTCTCTVRCAGLQMA